MAGILKNKLLRSYTLFELIMVMVLIGVIFFVTAPLMIEVGRNWQLASNRNVLSENGMVALDRVVREIRNLKDKNSILAASDSSFQFIDVNNETVTFSRSGNYLMRNSSQLASNVSSLTFTYYDAAGGVVALPTVGSGTNIHNVTVDISFSSAGTSLNLESGVYPRRLQ